MKDFLWRTCKEFLAVNARLKSKRIREDTRCSICNEGDETIRHTFFECCQAKSIWTVSEFKDITNDIPFEPPTRMLKWVMEKIGPEKMGKFTCIAWATWTWRNKKVLGGDETNLQSLVLAFLKMLEDYQRYASRVLEDSVVKSVPSFDKWYPPPPRLVED